MCTVNVKTNCQNKEVSARCQLATIRVVANLVPLIDIFKLVHYFTFTLRLNCMRKIKAKEITFENTILAFYSHREVYNCKDYIPILNVYIYTSSHLTLSYAIF